MRNRWGNQAPPVTAEVVAFDFTKGACLGTTAQFQRLNGQALAFFP
jgi:hypothetical protein